MHGNSWIGFFLRLPASLQDGLILSLSTGMEIIAQSFVRVDQEFLILKGRLAGTQDQGRIVVLPYAQLVYSAFARKLTEEETASVFSEPLAPVVFQMPEPTSAPEQVPREPAPREPSVHRVPAAATTPTLILPAETLLQVNAPVTTPPAEPELAPAEEAVANKPNLPSKAELLERLRTRLGEVGKK